MKRIRNRMMAPSRMILAAMLVAAVLTIFAASLVWAGDEGTSQTDTPTAALRSASGQLVDAPGSEAAVSRSPMEVAAAADVRPTPETPALLVVFSSTTGQDERRTILEGLALREIRTIDELGVSVVEAVEQLPASERVELYEEALAALSRIPSVLWAEPSRELEQQIIPNDPIYPEQWGPAAVGLPSAWAETTGSPSVTIAIIDSGLGYTIDFADRVVAPYSIEYDTSAQWAWTDIDGHGTACAGIAAAMGNDGRGMVGAAWDVRIMPIHVSDTGACSDWTAAAALVYAANMGADIINLSWGGRYYGQTLAAALDYVLDRGVILVAAAGNSGAGMGIDYPARHPGVIAVGATNIYNNRSLFSSTGDQLALVAPGENVTTYQYAGSSSWTFSPISGTSFATPMVAGVAGLMLSKNGALSRSRVAHILSATATDLGNPGWDPYFGDGLLDASMAVRSAGDRVSPGLVFIEPLDGSTVSGETKVVLSVSDNVGVYKVEHYLDGQIAFTTMARAPHYHSRALGGDLYIQDLDKPLVGVLYADRSPDGSTHTLMARAYDMAGNTRTASATVTVNNSPDPITPPPDDTGQFRDVDPTHHYYNQIVDLASRGIISGFPGGYFGPDDPVKRQQFAKIIVRALELPVRESDICPFSDVGMSQDPNDPLYPDKYVAVCAAHGITTGKTADKFAPGDDMTRAQLITMVARAAHLPEPPQSFAPSFGNFSEDHYPWARKAAHAGLLKGFRGLDSGSDFWVTAGRGEVCVLLYNLLTR